MSSTFNKINDLPFVARHIRPYTDDYFEESVSAYGGISIGFLIDIANNKLSFTFASCRDTERFVRKNAFKILQGRMTAGRDVFVMDGYDRTYSLVENAYSALRNFILPGEYEEEASNPNAILLSRPEKIEEVVIQKFLDYAQVYYEGTYYSTESPDSSLVL